MADLRTSYWRRHYGQAHLQARPWLDLSNEAVQAQTFSLALETAGAVRGLRCLDVGCGWGRLAVILEHLGAAQVTAVDQVAEFVEAGRRARPLIRWIAADAADPAVVRDLPAVDLLFAVEILQYVPFEKTVPALWERVLPGGRLIGVAPNGDCPLARSVRDRYEGLYRPPSEKEILACVGGLPAVEHWAVRGLSFQADQRLVPYAAGPWRREPCGPPAPNRFLFVAVRPGDARLGSSRP